MRFLGSDAVLVRGNIYSAKNLAYSPASPVNLSSLDTMGALGQGESSSSHLMPQTLTNEKGFLMSFLHSDRSFSAESIYELT